MNRICVIALGLIVSTRIFAASVQTRVSPSEVRVGDEITLEVSVADAGGKPVRFPFPEPDGFALLKIDSSKLQQNAIQYTLAGYDTGMVSIAEMPVVIGTGISAETLQTSPQSVRIQSSLSAADTSIVPNKPYRLHPFQWRELLAFVWIPIALLVAFLAWWIWKRYFSKKAGEEEIPPELLLPPHEVAIRELIALRDCKYPSRGMLKEFFSEYSEIMRRYVERRYGFPALEMTTYDLEREFERDGFPSDLRTRLLPSLRESDLVKFAKYLPDFSTCDNHIELGFEIVELTRERPQIETAEAKAA